VNPYLTSLRARYDALRQSIEQLQTRAAGESRDLTEPELRSVTEQSEQAQTLFEQIEVLTAAETRNRQTDELAASLTDDVEGLGGDRRQGDLGEQRGTGLGTEARDRDPGHYTRSAPRSFFADIYRAKEGDTAAATRLAEHNRALTTGGPAGAGVVPPNWLVAEYDEIARQGRALADAVRRIPLGNDPRPLTLPKQTAQVDGSVLEQATEGVATAESDLYGSGVDTVVPKPTVGKQTVSRQLLDMSSPAADLLIFGDLMGAYNDKVEAKVCAAVIAAAGASVTSLATEAAFTVNAAQDAVIDVAMGVWNARKRPADLLAMSVLRWGKFKKLRDSTGRPLIPAGTGGTMNVPGRGAIQVPGQIEELGVIVTDGFGGGSTYPESVAALRGADTILFESDVMRFRFEEVEGPELVKLGIWGYTAVLVRQSGKSVKRFQVTAA
jgi:HK97 family phage major capsid protein